MTSNIRNRRTFLRQAAALGGISTVGSPAGCLGDGPALDPDDTNDDGEPVAEVMDLHSGMEIGMGFAGLGGLATPSEVNPDEPGGGD